SLLWKKDYISAKTYYEKIIEKYPTNFTALLGYANTLSNLNDFKNALSWVEKALSEKTNNNNALISRKYIRLGFANQLLKKNDFEIAENLYYENLNDFENDKETLLNLANFYLQTQKYQKAIESFQKINKTKTDTLIALNGISLANHLKGKENLALQIAQKSKKILFESIIENQVKKQTLERFTQAHIWNKKYNEAHNQIKEYKIVYPNENWVLALDATLNLYKSNFKNSILSYQNILVNDSLSFDGNLGIANAFYANGEPKKAYKAVEKTLTIFENQKDGLNLKQKINLFFAPSFEEKINYSFDNGENYAFATLTQFQLPLSTKWNTNFSYQYRHTKNKLTDRSAISKDIKLGIQYQFHSKISWNFNITNTLVNSFSNDFSQWLMESSIKIKPYQLQDLELGFKQEIQNFNADLLNQNIISNHYFINYNIATHKNIGWFTQYYYSNQSDNNTRNLLFTSIYYNILSKPTLKTGFNYQYMSFAEKRPTVYFSPSNFNAYEVFIDFLRDQNSFEGGGIFYNLQAATGYQFIEDLDKQNTYRLQAGLGYKFSDKFWCKIYGLKSNIASTTAAGFTYNEFGFQLKWIITSKPLFNLN
ncbi:MAG: tetratricopeptide repeat protein, partial [Flavobacterium sp.]